jgi:hypothetical protein
MTQYFRNGSIGKVVEKSGMLWLIEEQIGENWNGSKK